MKRLITSLFLVAAASALCAQDIELPAPHKTGGLPLMEALAKRATSRAFDSRELSHQQLSDLLWAGFGINRSDGKRTAPSHRNKKELDIYLLSKQGAYLYDAEKNTLRQVSSEDVRSLAAKTDAAICVVYVADFSKRQEKTVEEKTNIGAVDSGFISQNIYLYCASEGLATGYRAFLANAPALAPKLALRSDQAIIAAQPIGYPKL